MTSQHSYLPGDVLKVAIATLDATVHGAVVQGATLAVTDGDIVLYGGDKSGVCVCTPGVTEWRWNSVIPTGSAPPDRLLHSMTVLGEQLVVFGGSSLEDGNDLADMYMLKKSSSGWVWTCPRTHVKQAGCAQTAGCCQIKNLSGCGVNMVPARLLY